MDSKSTRTCQTENRKDDRIIDETPPGNSSNSGNRMTDSLDYGKKGSRCEASYRPAASSSRKACDHTESETRVPTTGSATVALGKRAPVTVRTKRTRKFYLNIFNIKYVYQSAVEHVSSQCVRFRSQEVYSKDVEVSLGKTKVPRGPDRNIGMAIPFQAARTWDPGFPARSFTPDGTQDVEMGDNTTPAHAVTDNFAIGRPRDVNCGCLGIYWASETQYQLEIPIQPTYVVVGVFPHGQPNPVERIFFCHEPKLIFRQLHSNIFYLRGFWKTFFSLRHVKGLRLYMCNPKDGTHQRVNLDINGDADMELLLHWYKQWIVPEYIALDWANWIHRELNHGSLSVLDGKYSLELVLGWSGARITIVILLPLVLSLVIGLWLNSQAWTDLTTIQTAWTIASYIVTAGGFIAALLGIVSSLADK